MAALEPHYMTILKRVLEDRFVPYLPPLLDTKKPATEQKEKQLSRAFSAFALHKLCGLTPQDAGRAVVDDFHDKGLDAIFYDEKAETIFLLQTKLKGTSKNPYFPAPCSIAMNKFKSRARMGAKNQDGWASKGLSRGISPAFRPPRAQ